MSIPIARLGDKTIGSCKIHGPGIGGTIITSSTNCYANGLGIARLGDTIKANCGHTATIVTSSTVDYANNLGIARLGDKGSGVYTCTIISGSTDTYTT